MNQLPLPAAEVNSHNRQPRVYARSEHSISRQYISDKALKVLYRLRKAGFEAYLVGGGVRDLLLGREPKDFDVATDAHPEQVRELFRNCRLIGRRFRLAHVRFGREVIEVATLRAAHDGDADGAVISSAGRILRDNVYGSIDEDVWRRDFTVNALYYDIRDFSVVDYVGGVEDIRAGRLRLIGDPAQRFHEDPVRMLRAVRFAVKLGFNIDEATAAPLKKLGTLLETIAPSRLFDETLKIFHGGVALQSFRALRQYNLFAWLFPETDRMLHQQDGGFPDRLISLVLQSTDHRVAEELPITPAFLFAGLLWSVVEERKQELIANGVPAVEAASLAADTTISKQIARVAIPRRFTQMTREIWGLQHRFGKRTRKRCRKLAEHQRFRAAYDFLLLRAEAGEPVSELAQWWTRYQEVDDHQRVKMVDAVRKEESGHSGGRHQASRRV